MQQDTYTWQAIYDDDSHLDEQDATQGFASVDQERIKSLAFLTSDGLTTHSVQIPSGAQGVFFRRRRVMVNVESDSAMNDATTHCIGWKQGNQAIYLFIRGDGSSLLTTDLQAG